MTDHIDRDSAIAAQQVRLTLMRSDIERERAAALAAEPWDRLIRAVPIRDLQTGEVEGIASLPSASAKDLFGGRLAFDVLSADNTEQVDDLLGLYFSLLDGDVDHLFAVFAAALRTICDHVMPALLAVIEDQAGNYDTRVTLAEAARNAWAARITGSGDDGQPGREPL